jgi:membrane protease subunit HflK
MPWSNQGGGGWQGGSGGGGGPWGQGGGGRPQGPDLEELLRKGQDRVRRLIPGGTSSPRAIILILLVLVAVWLVSGFYRVQADEQGVVLRFGEWTRTTQPGLHYHLPAPLESVLTPQVTRNNRIEIGFRSGGDGRRPTARRDFAEESLMLTGDENIVDIDFTVLWQIRDAGKFLFNIQVPVETVKAAAESAMREVVGRTPIQLVLAEGRRDVETQTQGLLQIIIDSYDSGIIILEVKLQRVDPPAAVIDSFRDVQRARADRDRQINEAQAYSNDILPRARGEAEQLRLGAEGYKEQVVRTAEGDVSRFLAIYEQYKLAPEVTVRRMYYETMEKVFGGMQKIIIDESAEGQGVVPYLPLGELTSRGRTQR